MGAVEQQQASAPEETPATRGSQRRWRQLRYALAAVYVLTLAVVIWRTGVPTSRIQLAGLMIAALVISSLGRGWRRVAQVLLDWLPFTAVLVLYDQSRGLADSIGMPLHEADISRAERWLFDGYVPSVWLQQHFYQPGHVRWYDAVATLVYTTHFLMTPVLAAVLWVRDRAVWLRYISRVVVLCFAGLLTYLLFPEAPPWMASRDGYIGPVQRLSARGWEFFHASFAHRALAAGQKGGSNPVAAMPSLHLALALLAAMFVAGLLHSRWRLLVYLYPLAMGLTLVYTGEHWVIDLLAGAVYAVAANVGVGRWERRRARSRH